MHTATSQPGSHQEPASGPIAGHRPQPRFDSAANAPQIYDPQNLTDVTQAPRWASEEERLQAFGKALDSIRKRVESELGDDDVAYVKKMRRLSNACQWVGRGMIHFSFEPVGFSAGVIALWLHKQLEATEIGHTAMHGAFDKLDGADKFRSKTFNWKIPIDERSWHQGHNLRHHQYTNIAGKDPDIHFGPVRLNEHTPWRASHRWQMLYTLGFLFPNFGFLMNMHFTGLVDLYNGNGRDDEFDFLPDRSWKSVKKAHWAALRKFVPYYAREYALFPLLAGPMWWKVALGNWMSEMMRDIYSAATIFCGHVGEETAAYPEGTRAHGRGQWYAMQVESANNFDVPLPVSQLCGALDLQIEHHLFPKFPTNRLREIAPDVRAICDDYDVEYRSDSWPNTLKQALNQIAHLSRDTHRPLLGRVGNIMEVMS